MKMKILKWRFNRRVLSSSTAKDWFGKAGLFISMILVTKVVINTFFDGDPAVFIDITSSRFNGSVTPRDILILTIVTDKVNSSDYSLAHDSLQCYAAHHRYSLLTIDLSTNSTLKEICNQTDFFFTRHCIVAQILLELPHEWILFLDADSGVINPNRLIEEWIDDDVNIIFYDRIYNHEVAAGGYLVKNTEYSRNFLNYFADFDAKVEHGMNQGTDNGAIQLAILDYVAPEKSMERELCYNIWKKTYNFEDLFVHEACVRMLMGGQHKWMGKVKIMPKGQAWVRDAFLAKSKWAPRDFMIHGWKWMNFPVHWVVPFKTTKFKMSYCETADAKYNWDYKTSLITSDQGVEELLIPHYEEANRRFKSDLGRMHLYV